MKSAVLAATMAVTLSGCFTRESANVYATGGIAGSTVGQGKGSSVAGVLGAVAGGVAGQAIEEKVTRKDALEITVRLDSGELRAIVQEADADIRPGQRVRLLTSGGVTRVTP